MGAWRGGARPAGGGGVASVACARTLRGAALVLGAASTPGWGRRARADRRRGSASEGGTAGPPFPERGGGRVQRGRGAAAVQAPVRAPQPGDTGLCRAGAARRGGVSWTQGPASPSFSGEPCGRPDAAARRVPRWIHVCPRRIAALSLRAARGGSPGWISPPPPPPLPGRPAVAAASRLPAARGGSSGGSLLPPPPPRSTSRRGPLARRGPRDCVLRVRMQLTCAPVAPRISSRPGFLGCWMIWVASRHGGIFILHAWLKFWASLSFEEGGVLSEFRRWSDWPSGSVDEPSSRGTESSALCCAVRPRGRICQERTYKDLEDPGKLLPSRILHGCSRSCGWTDGRTEDGSNGGPAPSPGPLGPGGS
ncbi:uncharacterized protein MT0007 isoform X2 [Camelus dromedarius]|uniref:uncharacterized protein MT0007 isoform X2 n=1 Tax=Camelus dromedarius TaxID=9838 RepID=UPI0031195500